jgi:hypothetical protein
MTTAAVMDGKPLTMTEACRVYDRLYDDDRVTFISEPPEVDKRFREKASRRTASPKVWADAWLLVVAQAAEGILVSFDMALASQGRQLFAAEKRRERQRLTICGGTDDKNWVDYAHCPKKSAPHRFPSHGPGRTL